MGNCLGSATGPYKKQNRVPLIATHSPTTQILTQAGYTAHSRLKGQNTSRADQTFLFRHNQHLQTGVTAHLYCRDTERDACRLYHEGKKEKEDIMQMVRKTISTFLYISQRISKHQRSKFIKHESLFIAMTMIIDYVSIG